MMVKISVGGKEYEIKENYTVLDQMNTLQEPELKKALEIQVRMVCRVSTSPKLSNKDVLMMNYGEFMQFYKEIRKAYGIPSAYTFLGNE